MTILHSEYAVSVYSCRGDRGCENDLWSTKWTGRGNYWGKTWWVQ